LANHKHTLKSQRQDIVRRERNRGLRTRLRRVLKSLRSALDEGKTDDAKSAFSGTISLIDKMSAKGIIHDNAAARYKSRLARRLAGATATAAS
jgi:small subunit ribosomal protein S20